MRAPGQNSGHYLPTYRDLRRNKFLATLEFGSTEELGSDILLDKRRVWFVYG